MNFENYQSFVHSLPKKLLGWVQIESIDFQVEGVIPRIAASDVQVKSASLAVFEVGVDDQQPAVFDLPEWSLEHIALGSNDAGATAANILLICRGAWPICDCNLRE
jgi:hypothetical protein